MPGPLRFLVLISLASAVFVPITIFSDGITIDGQFVAAGKWWSSGSGSVFVVSLVPWVTSGVMMLKRARHGRTAFLSGFIFMYAGEMLAIRMSTGPYSASAMWASVAWVAAQVVACSGYLYGSKSVRAYFTSTSAGK
jgi:hypothetical protein